MWLWFRKKWTSFEKVFEPEKIQIRIKFFYLWVHKKGSVFLLVLCCCCVCLCVCFGVWLPLACALQAHAGGGDCCCCHDSSAAAAPSPAVQRWSGMPRPHLSILTPPRPNEPACVSGVCAGQACASYFMSFHVISCYFMSFHHLASCISSTGQVWTQEELWDSPSTPRGRKHPKTALILKGLLSLQNGCMWFYLDYLTKPV